MRAAVLALGLVGALAGSAWGQTPEARFDQLSEAQKEDLRGRLERFKSLPPQEQLRIRENLRRFEQMSPEEQGRVKANYEAFKALPAAEQQRIRELYIRYQALSPDGRDGLRLRLQKIMGQTDPAKRAKLLENLQRWEQMTPEEREKLRDEVKERREDRNERRHHRE